MADIGGGAADDLSMTDVAFLAGGMQQALHVAPLHLVQSAAAVLPRMRERLAERGLVGPSPWTTAANYAPALVMLTVALVGVAKIAVGHFARQARGLSDRRNDR